MAQEPSHQDLHCLPFCFLDFRLKTPICITGQVQIQDWKSPLKKLRDERVDPWPEPQGSTPEIIMVLHKLAHREDVQQIVLKFMQ